MLHEVLLTLYGYSADFLCQLMDNDSLLDPSECMLIKRILNVASGYTSLKTFINSNIFVTVADRAVSDTCTGKDETHRPGVYLQAFCNGLNEVLAPYRNDIVKLEEKALEDPYLPLLTVVSKVEEYTKLFEVLNSIIKQISEQHIHGCQILDFLHREVNCNVNDVKEPLKSIIQCCHVVFFKQLSSWLLYGQLIDQYDEFFIHRALHTQGTSTSATLDSFSSQDISEMLSMESRRSSRDDSLLRYAIQYTMLPSYIIPSLAQKILFIGDTILMFGCEQRERSETISFTSKYITSVWGDREGEFFKKLQSLQAMKTFNHMEFEKIIDEFRSCVTEHLWKLAVEEAELFLQLKLMKDFFLLGRGELFLEFIRQAAGILQNPPTSTSTRDVNQAFHIAARKILINDDTIDKFRFMLPGKGNTEVDDIKGSCWHLLTLTYKVSWPLHLLFDSVALDNYNKLFRFLLCVKKTQLNLHSVWRNHMECKTQSVYEGEPAVWHLRNRLMFLVDNLQYYLQVDVFESQYTLLQSAVQATKDFEQIQKAHTLFQANILSQTFLLADKISNGSETKPNPVQLALGKVLDLCETFCTSLCMWENDIKEPQLLQLHDMVQEYENLVMYLLQLLSDLSLHPCGSHLSQLLLRLDFNRWFSKERNVTSSSIMDNSM